MILIFQNLQKPIKNQIKCLKKSLNSIFGHLGRYLKMAQMVFKLLSKNDHMRNDSLIILPQN